MRNTFTKLISVLLVFACLLAMAPAASASISWSKSECTGYGGEDIAAYARTKIGDGKNRDWSGSWCCAFICACAREVEQEKAIPHGNNNCENLTDAILDAGGKTVYRLTSDGPKFYLSDDERNPQPGDIVFIDNTPNNKKYERNHAGIVTFYGTGESNKLCIGTVEGNYSNKVAKHQFDEQKDEKIFSRRRGNETIVRIIRPNYRFWSQDSISHHDTNVTVDLVSGCKLYKKPNTDSAVLKSGLSSQTVTSQYIAENPKKNYWYHVKVDGKSGYVRAEDCRNVNLSPKAVVLLGENSLESYSSSKKDITLEGILRAKGCTIRTVYGKILHNGSTAENKGGVKQSTKKTGFKKYRLDLSQTNINDLTVRYLEPGTYDYVVSVYAAYYSADEKNELSYERQTLIVHTDNYEIVSPSVDAPPTDVPAEPSAPPQVTEEKSAELLEIPYFISFVNDNAFPGFEVLDENGEYDRTDTTVSFTYDLTRDGQEDTVTLTIIDSEAWDPYRLSVEITDGLAGKSCTRTVDVYGALTVRVVDLDTADASLQLVLSSVLESDDGYITDYFGDCFDTTKDNHIEYLEYSDVHDGALRVHSYTWLFGTPWIYKSYHYTNGVISLVTKDGEWDLDYPMRSKREIPVQWLENGEYADGILPAESEITFTRSDCTSYMKFKSVGGREGRFFFQYNGEASMDESGVASIDGIPDFDLFYDVEYSG